MINKEELLRQFESVVDLAEGSALTRLLSNPIKYAKFILINKLLYKTLHRSFTAKAFLFFGDKMWVDLPAGTDIFLAAGKTHDSELRLAKFLIRQLYAGDVFYDIGAHFGYYSLLARHLVGDAGFVYAFEPSVLNWRFLQKNTNGRKGIIISNKAVSSEAGEAKFYEFPALYSEYNAMHVEQFSKEDWYKQSSVKETIIDSISLDEIISGGARMPDMIKIDVEGAEDKVIAGGKGLFQNISPVVVMEYLSDNRYNEGHNQAAAFLSDLDYESFAIDNDGKLISVRDINSYLATARSDSDNIVFKKKTGVE